MSDGPVTSECNEVLVSISPNTIRYAMRMITCDKRTRHGDSEARRNGLRDTLTLDSFRRSPLIMQHDSSPGGLSKSQQSRCPTSPARPHPAGKSPARHNERAKNAHRTPEAGATYRALPL
jgi:hypothetical protein